MLCQFCRHEFDDSLTECPYCHRQGDFEPKSLTREERDSFSGTTIDMGGSSDESERCSEYQERDSYRGDETFQRADRPYEEKDRPAGFKVYRMGGGFLTWIVFALIVLGIIFFILPAVFLFAVAGAIAGAVIIFLSRLFQ